VVKETNSGGTPVTPPTVSIPSRGSGKGDFCSAECSAKTSNLSKSRAIRMFQSPLGEVVKETRPHQAHGTARCNVSIPSRGSGKGDSSARKPYPERVSSLKSTHHFLPVNKTVKPAISSVACKP
jgi:hypothetical protein